MEPGITNPREFMLTVNRADFEILKTSPFNVVLQDKAPPDDDGSLSRLCTKLGGAVREH